jgi:hydroxymethylpyrimidine/phosphomethylpyrimidine kinase
MSTMNTTDTDEHLSGDDEDTGYPSVLVFNASDPSGAGGVTADVLSCNSVGAHVLSVVTGCYIKDTAEIHSHVALDADAISDQARTVLEDVSVQVFKVGFCGGPEALGVIAEITADYAEAPVVAYMPSLAWWEDEEIESYLDAFRELILPQTTLLVGNYSTLSRWLWPEWTASKPPSPKDIAKAAAEMGVPYTLVTGMTPNAQTFENVLCSPYNVLLTQKFERLDASFTGGGDTLSAIICAFFSLGLDLENAVKESLNYLDGSLVSGYQPGMGLVLPDRLFWTQSLDDDEDAEHSASDDANESTSIEDFGFPKITTRH